MPATPTTAWLNAIGTAVPGHDIHSAFIGWARERLDARETRLFDRMVDRAGIGHRWSVLPASEDGGSPVGAGGFYADAMPGTAARMRIYADSAPILAIAAIEALREQVDLSGITHLVVASCTGFVAPGIDQIVAARIGLAPTVERLLVGFMGCYAAVAALRSARHIVRSDPDARVLVVTVELSTLHLQPATDLEPLLAMLQFGDGAAAALVSGKAQGYAIDTPFAATLPDSAALIRWDITDAGFAMHLSGEVPGRIATALTDPAFAAAATGGRSLAAVDGWAVHAGGRSILDAVERSLSLPPDSLAVSRGVLAANGNMSSATLMFVLAAMLAGPRVDNGIALAFGPGLAAEGFGFRSAA
ncbi:stilbene synthase [Sphingomonas sp. Leaf407]|uniref:type III polyketide synthase n=1 Tax=unclassified Sphingomonas TaxID=196159 RepID=UPI000700FA10|nr:MULTISPECIES: type III polyketide synthase [unclassified Sphingomonas]KQN35779.1 stilbene synthase [Sphingomonas sp. Leaf42]KQT26647.1 stilbene synthase [Sphingomonas sp. Leaf407]